MALFETKRIELPGEGWVEIRELSVGALKAADQKGTESAAALMQMLPETIVEKALQDQRDRAMERIIRYEGYDPETLIKYGLVGWSFPETCNDETKAELGAKQGEIIARAIFELSVLPSGEVVGSSPKSVEGESPSNLPAPASSTPPEEV